MPRGSSITLKPDNSPFADSSSSLSLGFLRMLADCGERRPSSRRFSQCVAKEG